ncbi:MAG: four helix bundle protein [Chloroflexi bacterium]|nr:four helix bundle protein [Chloroflexota bacterium]
MIASYEAWLDGVSGQIKNDALWDLDVYRKALFFFDLAWHDCDGLLKHELGKPIGWQLIRSAGSVSANMEEGFGRGFGKDYARFLKIALGSARESRGWYFRSRHVLKPDVIEHRMNLLRTIIAGLTTLSKQQSQR